MRNTIIVALEQMVSATAMPQPSASICKHSDKDDIQHRVNKAARGDDHSGPARVAHGAQQCRSHIEQQRRNHRGKIAASIGHALGQ